MSKNLGIILTIIGFFQIFLIQLVSNTISETNTLDVDIITRINLMQTSAIVIPVIFIVLGIALIVYSFVSSKKDK